MSKKSLSSAQLTSLRLEKQKLLSELDKLTGNCRETRNTPIKLPLNVSGEIKKIKKRVADIDAIILPLKKSLSFSLKPEIITNMFRSPVSSQSNTHGNSTFNVPVSDTDIPSTLTGATILCDVPAISCSGNTPLTTTVTTSAITSAISSTSRGEIITSIPFISSLSNQYSEVFDEMKDLRLEMTNQKEAFQRDLDIFTPKKYTGTIPKQLTYINDEPSDEYKDFSPSKNTGAEGINDSQSLSNRNPQHPIRTLYRQIPSAPNRDSGMENNFPEPQQFSEIKPSYKLQNTQNFQNTLSENFSNRSNLPLQDQSYRLDQQYSRQYPEDNFSHRMTHENLDYGTSRENYSHFPENGFQSQGQLRVQNYPRQSIPENNFRSNEPTRDNNYSRHFPENISRNHNDSEQSRENNNFSRFSIPENNSRCQLIVPRERNDPPQRSFQSSYDNYFEYNQNNNRSRRLDNECRGTFLRQLRSIPSFNGESRQDLMNFIEIGDTLNSFSRNEAEYCEFIMQVCLQLRGMARAIITNDPDWNKMKQDLLEQFNYLTDRNVTNSKIENLRQEKNETLNQYADRTRKLLLEKNQAYNNLTFDQRIDHDRAIRKAFSRGIGNLTLRDRVLLRGSSSLEKAISCAFEFEYDSTNTIHKSEFLCKFCKAVGHREFECRKKEEGGSQMNQLITALNNLGMGNSNHRGRNSESNSSQNNNSRQNVSSGRNFNSNNNRNNSNNYQGNNRNTNYNGNNGNYVNNDNNNNRQNNYNGNNNRQTNNNGNRENSGNGNGNGYQNFNNRNAQNSNGNRNNNNNYGNNNNQNNRGNHPRSQNLITNYDPEYDQPSFRNPLNEEYSEN